MTQILRNEDFIEAPSERTLIYENDCIIDCKPSVERIYQNINNTFDAVITICGEIAAEWHNCPNVEYAAESIKEFDGTY
jgi:hypothetical protein